MILTPDPIAVGDKLVENLALTTPLDPWERVTLPQTTLNLEPALATLDL